MKIILPIVFVVVLAAAIGVPVLIENNKTQPQIPENPESLGNYVVCSFDAEGEVVTEEALEPFAYKGKTFYFSSQDCRNLVTSEPEKYLE